jgi:glycosyltransferase involved in cell wall biosynthesis
MTRLTVAVAIPTIPGRERSLERALESVFAQTRPPDQILTELDVERTGAAATRNRLLARVESDVIAWLDDDDEFMPPHISVCMRPFEVPRGKFDPAPDLVYPSPRMVGGPDPTAVTFQGNLRLPWGVRFGKEQEAHLRRNGSFIPMTHLVRTSAMWRIKGFREGYHVPDPKYPAGQRYRGEDEDYLIRLLDTGATFEHIDRRTWKWYSHPATSTAGRGRTA